MSNQPAYRNRNRAAPSGGWGILVPFFLAMILAIWPYAVWHGCKYGGSGLSGCGAESEWVWNAQTWAACGIWWGILASPFVIAGFASAGKRRRTLPAVTGLRPPPPSVCVAAPPLCLHLNAVKVDSAFDKTLIYRCWCPDCEAELPAAWRRPCCATGPGTRHVYNCPHAGLN
jgi:hypothetical protein